MIQSKYRKVRSDVVVERPESQQSQVLIELKAYSTENTRPSSIRDAIRGTLRKYAQFGGFIEVVTEDFRDVRYYYLVAERFIVSGGASPIRIE